MARFILLLSAILGLATAVALPDPTSEPVLGRIVAPGAPIVTPAPIRFEGRHSYVRRDIIDNIKSGVNGIEKSWASVIGQDLPSFFTEGEERKASTLFIKICADMASRHSRLVRRPPYRYDLAV